MTTLIQALCKARAEFQPLVKSIHVEIKMKNGSKYSYDYCPMNEILDAVMPALIKQNLYPVHHINSVGDKQLCVHTVLKHGDSEETLDSQVIIDKVYDYNGVVDTKKTAGDVSYWERYLLIGLLCLAADTNDEPPNYITDDSYTTQPRYQKPAKTNQKPKPLPQNRPNVKQAQPVKNVNTTAPAISPEFKYNIEESTRLMGLLKLDAEHGKSMLLEMFNKRSRQLLSDVELKQFVATLSQSYNNQLCNSISTFLEESILNDDSEMVYFESELRKRFGTTSMSNLNEVQLNQTYNLLLNGDFFQDEMVEPTQDTKTPQIQDDESQDDIDPVLEGYLNHLAEMSDDLGIDQDDLDYYSASTFGSRLMQLNSEQLNQLVQDAKAGKIKKIQTVEV